MSYRPPGRSSRLARSNAENEILEGLPVKQWGQTPSHVSLAPPKAENANGDDKWAEPPMPRDFQLLQPWTQHLLRLARSGKIGTKRKADPDSIDDDKAEEEIVDEIKQDLEQNRGFVAKKWKHVPEALLQPEHRHFEFLAKRRKGLPRIYGHEEDSAAHLPLRKTKVQKTGADGEVAVYEVLVPEGRVVDGELPAEALETTEARSLGPGTVIEGIGIANEDGVIVTEHSRAPAAPRRNRPPPKRKGGPGRGKKRVTFTNPDGSTYTTIVPNATKIVPQPGQTVQHVAKGVEARADMAATQTSSLNASEQGQEGGEEGEGEGEGGEEGEGEGSDDNEDDQDDDDNREEGELSDSEDAPNSTNATPAAAISSTPPPTLKRKKSATPKNSSTPKPASKPSTPAPPPVEEAELDPSAAPEDSIEAPGKTKSREASSSPDLPLAKTRSHSRQDSTATAAAAPTDAEETEPQKDADAALLDEQGDVEMTTKENDEPESVVAEDKVENVVAGSEVTEQKVEDSVETQTFDDGDEDLLGGLEKSLGV